MFSITYMNLYPTAYPSNSLVVVYMTCTNTDTNLLKKYFLNYSPLLASYSFKNFVLQIGSTISSEINGSNYPSSDKKIQTHNLSITSLPPLPKVQGLPKQVIYLYA